MDLIEKFMILDIRHGSWRQKENTFSWDLLKKTQKILEDYAGEKKKEKKEEKEICLKILSLKESKEKTQFQNNYKQKKHKG